MIRLCLTLVLCMAACASAHPTLATVAVVELDRNARGGEIELRVTHDVLAYALNDTSERVMDWQMYDLLEGPPAVLGAALHESRERFAASFQVTVDGVPVSMAVVSAPTLETVDAWRLENPSLRLPLAGEFVLRGTLPATAAELAIRGPYVLDQMLLSVHRAGREAMIVHVPTGEWSAAIDVAYVGSTTPLVPSDAHTSRRTPVGAGSSRALDGYVGFFDRATMPQLFVLALFLLGLRFEQNVAGISAFLVGLGGAFGLVSVGAVDAAPKMLDVATPASVVVLAIAGLVSSDRARGWTSPLLLLGLLQGASLATDPTIVALPDHDRWTSVAGMSLGLAAGCVTVFFALCLVLGWLRRAPWFRAWIAVPTLVVVLLVSAWSMASSIMGM